MSEHDAMVSAIASPERAVRDIGDLIGDRLAFGPVTAGPGGMATAHATPTTMAMARPSIETMMV